VWFLAEVEDMSKSSGFSSLRKKERDVLMIINDKDSFPRNKRDLGFFKIGRRGKGSHLSV